VRRSRYRSGALNKSSYNTSNRRSEHTLLVATLIALAMISGCVTGTGKEILVDGSSTVFPISQAVAEEFRKERPDVQIPVGISGTGGGLKRFVTGGIDVADASRRIKDSERDEAAANGIEYTEFTVAYDGLSIVVNSSNNFVSCLTSDELKRIWEPGSKLERWSQVRDGFPDRPLRLYGPDTDSGTFDYFTKAINGEEDASRSDYTASSDDNVLVQGVSGDQGSIGYFGFAYYTENREILKVLGVDNGTGCVRPSVTTINDGSYSPLSRPMFIYVNNASLEHEYVQAFVRFYLSNAAELAEEVGYVGLPDSEYQIQLDRLN
jgi:phosphate transport system substrate-binding protein